jgi:hypothetical protein
MVPDTAYGEKILAKTTPPLIHNVKGIRGFLFV